MSRSVKDVIEYLAMLREDKALHVWRISQYAGHDLKLLRKVRARWVEDRRLDQACFDGSPSTCESHYFSIRETLSPGEQAKYLNRLFGDAKPTAAYRCTQTEFEGVRRALTLAIADAEERVYKSRTRR
jgi:hypothetical protein